MTVVALWSVPRMAGALLILGSVIVLSSAALYMFVRDESTPFIFGQPPQVWLRLVGKHPTLWRRATLSFIAGPIVALMGFGLLSAVLHGAGDQGYAQLGLLALAFGAVLWVINLAARMSIDPWAARLLAETGAIPESYSAISLWTGVLFAIYTILTFAALALYGGAILATPDTSAAALGRMGVHPLWPGRAGLFRGHARRAPVPALPDADPDRHRSANPALSGKGDTKGCLAVRRNGRALSNWPCRDTACRRLRCTYRSLRTWCGPRRKA
jgi:hypothetical protein